MKSMLLQGVDPLCGRICITLDPKRPSKGRICQKERGGPCFPANSCFEMFVRVELKDLNRVLIACEPAKMCCMIDGVPPIGCTYQLDIGNLGRVPLYDDTATNAIAGGGAAVPCEVPDNGTGTITLPPPNCGYLSPQDVHMIIDGLPAGTTIQVGAEHTRFFNIQEQPGGSLDGNMENFGSTMNLKLQGTGALSTFQAMLTLQAQCETHTAPRMPGQPVQSFDTDMFRIQGQLPIGDPDFDLLRITAGTGFGLPSPGHTTLTRLPNGNWNVDSFFDITYRIDFVGRPGGRLMGMSGSTTGTIRMQTGSGGGPTDPCQQPAPVPTAFIVKAVHQPVPCAPDAPPAGDDTMPSELAHRIRIPGAGPGGGDLICDADMHGPVVIRRGAPHIDPATGRCTIDTEIVSMELTGIDPVCGMVRVRESPTRPSRGKIMQQGAAGGSMFPADSFFDIFVDIEVAPTGNPAGTVRLQNCLPARMECVITAIPPINCVYELNLSDVQLYPAGQCGPNVRPVGAIEVAQHIPRKPCPCPYGPGTDTMDSLLRHDIEIFGVGGASKLCTAPLSGPVVVERGEPYEITDAAGNKLCCVSTRMLSMNLTGTDPTCGDVKIRLCPERPSRGTICQMMPGACFPATSCFDVYIEVEVMGMILKNCKPIKMCCKINTIPPYGCVYLVDPGPEPLLLFRKGDCDSPNTRAVGQIRRAEHIPQPPCDPPVPFTSITCVGPNSEGTVVVKWDNNPQCPCRGRVRVTRTDPAGGVQTFDVPAGATSFTDVPDPKPFCVPGVAAVTFKYCVQCLSTTGAVVAQSCCEVSVRCPEPPACVDCIEGVRCQPKRGGVLEVTWTYKPNCQPRCEKVEIFLNSATGPVLLGTVPGTATSFETPCKPGRYCIRCICADGTAGPPHCCEPITSCPGFRVPLDCNSDDKVDIADGVCLLTFLYLGGQRLPCGDLRSPGNRALLDANGDEAVGLADALRIFGWLFLGAPTPVPCIDAKCRQCIPIPDCPDRCPPGQ